MKSGTSISLAEMERRLSRRRLLRFFLLTSGLILTLYVLIGPMISEAPRARIGVVIGPTIMMLCLLGFQTLTKGEGRSRLLVLLREIGRTDVDATVVGYEGPTCVSAHRHIRIAARPVREASDEDLTVLIRFALAGDAARTRVLTRDCGWIAVTGLMLPFAGAQIGLTVFLPSIILALAGFGFATAHAMMRSTPISVQSFRQLVREGVDSRILLETLERWMPNHPGLNQMRELATALPSAEISDRPLLA